ncbi:MAG: hypothetical protein MUC84_04190, partial [Solirubrobacteraceae bacterium]|nr:hypothetical protein [Solirubrobacteraceae bacterium]
MASTSRRGVLALALATAAVSATGAAPSPALATVKDRPLPSLLASAKNAATGRPVAKRMRLDLLDPRAFRVVRRPSAASVTLGWPADRPCAFTSFRLSILPDGTDADATARGVVPVAEGEGSAAWQGGRGADGSRPVYQGAWRVHSRIAENDRLLVSAVAVTPLRDSYGQPAGGLVVLRAESRTVPRTRCSGTNQFRIGP